MNPAAALQYVSDSAAIWSTTKAERVNTRWSAEMTTAEAYIVSTFAPVCGGSFVKAANCSTNEERRGTAAHITALRFAWICFQISQHCASSLIISIPCERCGTFIGNWCNNCDNTAHALRTVCESNRFSVSPAPRDFTFFANK